MQRGMRQGGVMWALLGLKALINRSRDANDHAVGAVADDAVRLSAVGVVADDAVRLSAVGVVADDAVADAVDVDIVRHNAVDVGSAVLLVLLVQ